MSARSTGELSLNNIPSKSKSFKYHTSLYSSTPIRCGEQEFMSLLLTQDMPLVARFLAQTSTNPEERKNFNTQLLTKDIFNLEKVELVGKKSVTSEIIRMQMLAIGLVNKRSDEKVDDIIEQVEDVIKATE